MQSAIPVFQPAIGADTLAAVAEAFRIGWLGMGSTTQTFEDRIGERLGIGSGRVLATNTGTSALHLALLAADVGPGDEVIVPSFNFIADVQAIVACGAAPVFCDIEPTTLGIDVGRAEALISPRTRAILPLHFAGVPCDLDGVRRLALQHGLRVVEDATHALGSMHDGRPIGSGGDLVCFSFDPVKIITSIDGGAVVAPDAATLERMRRQRLLGIDRDTIERYRNRRAWDYEVREVGFRYHLTNVNAAIGLSQLARLDAFIARRQEVCRFYNRALAGLPDVMLPRTDFEGVAPFIYTIRVAAARRAEIIERLRGRGVDIGIHFLPCHSQPLCAAMRRGPLPVTERVSAEILTLPLHSEMSDATAAYVAAAVCEAVAEPGVVMAGGAAL